MSSQQSCDHRDAIWQPGAQWYCGACGVPLYVIEESFAGLQAIARTILDDHYPVDIFPPPQSDTRDPGVQLVAAMRAVLDAQTGKDGRHGTA